MSGNSVLLAQLILQTLQDLQVYQRLSMQARAEGRDVTDAELDALGDIGRQIRTEARQEADRQRAEGR